MRISDWSSDVCSSDLAEAELQEVLAKLEAEGANPTLAASQRAWTEYRRHQAEYRSRINDPMPGSIAPMIYHDEMEKISRARIAELDRSEEHTSELQSLMRISYAVFCLTKKKTTLIYTKIL